MPAVPTGAQPCCERCSEWFCPEATCFRGCEAPGLQLAPRTDSAGSPAVCCPLPQRGCLAAPRSSSEGFSAETCQVQPLSVVCLLLGQTPQQALRGSETSACGRSPALPVRDLPGDLCDLGQRHGTPRVSCPSLPVNRGVDLTNGGGFLEMTTLVRPSSVPSVGRNGVEAQRSGRRAPLSSWSEERRQVSSCWLRPDP